MFGVTWSIKVGPTKKPFHSLPVLHRGHRPQFCALLLCALNISLHFVFMRLGNKWPKVVACICIVAELQFFISWVSLSITTSATSSPMATATESAIQRSPEEPKAAPNNEVTTLSISASAIMIAWFLHRLMLGNVYPLKSRYGKYIQQLVLNPQSWLPECEDDAIKHLPLLCHHSPR